MNLIFDVGSFLKPWKIHHTGFSNLSYRPLYLWFFLCVCVCVCAVPRNISTFFFISRSLHFTCLSCQRMQEEECWISTKKRGSFVFLPSPMFAARGENDITVKPNIRLDTRIRGNEKNRNFLTSLNLPSDRFEIAVLCDGEKGENPCAKQQSVPLI